MFGQQLILNMRVALRFGVLCSMFLMLGINSGAQLSRPAIPPEAPTDLVATVVGSVVTFDWLPPTGPPITGYSLEAALTAAGPAIGSVPVASAHLVVPGVPNGTYFVRVRGVNEDGAGPPSNEVMIVAGPPGCSGPPEAPTNLTSVIDRGVISLLWRPPSAGCVPTHYLLQAGSAPTLSDLATVMLGLSTTLTAQAPSGAYFVRVVAVNAGGTSPPSNEVIITVGPSCTVPGAPQSFTATASGASAFFQWAAPLTGDPPTDYLLEAGTAPDSSDIGALPLTGLSLTTQAPPGSYFVRVRGRNTCGAGPAAPTQLLTVVCNAPGTPSTPSASVFGSTATISWNTVGGATQYRLEVGTAAGASNIASQVLGTASGQLSGLPAGTYFMRVRALNACGSSAPSAESMFTIAAPPSSPSCGGAPAPQTVTCINGGHTGTPTAQCRDGAWSCSQNRSGTCSSHGGVSCWVCPGVLC